MGRYDNKSGIGNGKDNVGNAARQINRAAKATRKANAVKNAANAAVKAGAKTGKAVANIAAGTAAGGPWGAIISAAWSLKNTLFKILVATCLFLMFFVALIVSLPKIAFERMFEKRDEAYTGSQPTIELAFADLKEIVASSVESGYAFSKARAEKIMSDEKYIDGADRNKLTDESDAEYDVCYILAAYSASEKYGTDSKGLQNLLETIKTKMYLVTYTEYSVEEKNEKDELTSYSYVECVISSFNYSVLLSELNIDLSKTYGDGTITYEEAINYMSTALRLTIQYE